MNSLSFNNKPNACLVVTSHLEHPELLEVRADAYEAIICADGGLQVARELGLFPSKKTSSAGKPPLLYLIGDYDSGALPTAEERDLAEDVVVLPCGKDMTDSEAAIDWAVEKGYEYIHVLGGLGGRLDHTMGNLGLLKKYAGHPTVRSLVFEDGQNYVFMKAPGTFRIPAETRFPYFGLSAYGGPVEGLTITDAKYPLDEFTLTDDTTLCVSNEAAKASSYAEIVHSKGYLLVVLSCDK